MSDSTTPATRKRVALAPDLREMPDRAARAWTERMAVRHLGGAEYAVDSQSGTTYVVDVERGTCTCPDATIRGETVTTVAEYPTNEGYPDDDPVVAASYLTDAATGTARRYSFPLSRLRPVDDAALVE